ncbi:MAG: hypothetical protein R3E10_18350 [Gemmatimonadota bacterium]
MNSNQRLLTLTLALGALALSACDRTPSDPGLDDVLSPAGEPTLDAELVLAVDPALAEVALESAEARVQRVRSPQVEERLRRAREHFETARRRYAAGDHSDARRRGQQARESIADALIAGLGATSVEGMIQETESLVASLDVDGSAYDEPAQLGAMLAQLVAAAQVDKAQGNDRGAGEKMVRARQHVDQAGRRKDPSDRRPHDLFGRDDRVRLQVAMGGEAVATAGRLILTPTETQTRLLDTAAELQRLAEAALAQGEWGRANTLSREAEITALRAVIDVDGVDHAEANQIADLAEQLLAEAREVVERGAAAVDPAEAILELAERLFTEGSAQLGSGEVRGLALLWHSAAASSVLIP